MSEFIIAQYLGITENNEVVFYEGAFEELLKAMGVTGIDLYTAMNKVFNYLRLKGFEEKYIEREIENNDGFTEIFSLTYWSKSYDNFKDAYLELLKLEKVCHEIIKEYGGVKNEG